MCVVVLASLAFIAAMNHRLAAAGQGELARVSVAGSSVILLAMVATSSVGTVLVIRQHRHPVGWLLLLLGVEMALGAAATSYAVWGAVVRPGSLPAAAAVGVLADSSWIAWFVILAVLLQLMPTGRPLSGRWGAVAWFTVGCGVVWWSGIFTHHPLDPPLATVDNPMEFWANNHFVSAADHLAGLGTALGLVLAAASLIVRFHRSRGIERRQLLWLAVAAVPMPVLIVVAFVGAADGNALLVDVASGGLVLLLPVATALAVGRYHLYEVDRILSRAATYLVVSALLALAYATVVIATSLSLGDLAGRSTVTTVIATLVAVSGAAPTYRRVQNGLDRRFSRRRFEALRMAREYALNPTEDMDVDVMMRQALGDPEVEVGYWMRSRRVWFTAAGEPMAAEESDVVVSRHQHPVARLRVNRSADRDLAAAVATEALSELDNARLRAEIGVQLLEVQQSRQRLATTQLSERQRIGRDLHDGSQQRLLALGLHMRAALDSGDRQRLCQALRYGIAEVQTAVEELRDLANGLHPSVLTDSGLFAALDELSARSSLRIDIAGEEQRFPPEVETTAWFIACEAIANAVKHAGASRIQVQVSLQTGRLHLSIDDDGTGLADPAGRGIRGIQDRAEAVGGSLVVTTSERGGTSVQAELPCAC